MKTIDTKSYLDTICEIAQSGELVSIVVSGGSMVPFLSNRDTVYMKLPEEKLRKGDIVLYMRQNGDYVLHRIKRIRKDGYYMIGDRQTAQEGPVPKEQIKLLAVKVKRKDKVLTQKSFKWKFYSRIWNNLIFLRPAVFCALRLTKSGKSPD